MGVTMNLDRGFAMKPLAAALVLAIAALGTVGQAAPAETPPAAPPATSAPAPGPRAINEALATPLPLVEFHETPFSEALNTLSQQLGTTIVARWQVLRDVGIDGATPISLNLRNLSLDQVLWILLNQLHTSDTPLAYVASRDFIVVSTAADLGQQMITRVYDVSELIARPNLSFPGEGPQPGDSATRAGREVGFGDAVGGRRWARSYGRSTARAAYGGMIAEWQDRLPKLIAAITATIEPQSWSRNGGRGTIEPFQYKLIVYNTLAVHQILGGTLYGPAWRSNESQPPEAAPGTANPNPDTSPPRAAPPADDRR